MPIYAYRCTQCGFEKDVMRKISDPLLTLCPECNTEHFAKQLTAPGFQLKGSGWYATDFKGGNKPAESKSEAKTDAKVETKVESKTETPAASPPPCQGGAGSCACN